jgi:hypothetical protein
MESIRLRLLGFVEWVAAAACVLVVLAAVAGVTRQIHIVRPVVPVIAEEARPAIVPAGLRPGAIAVPELILPDGQRLAVGEPAALPLASLGARAQSEPAAFERDGIRLRESRIFRYAGLEFVIVTEGDRIVAIYR